MTKLYRVIAYVLDLNHNASTKEDVVSQIEHNKYPEFIDVMEVRETEVGEWSDDHKLNSTKATMADYDAYFAELGAETGDLWLKQEHQRVRGIMLAQIQKNGDLQRENEELKKKIQGLQKVQEFVNTVKELTK